MSNEDEPPVGQHEWEKGFYGNRGQCSRCGARASLAMGGSCDWRPREEPPVEARPGFIGSYPQSVDGSSEMGRHVSGADRPAPAWHQRVSRAGMHFRAALRHLGYCLSDLVGWQREPIAVEMAPDGSEDQHPAALCKCEVGADAPQEQHDKGCLWAPVMCRHYEGLGQCPTCSGDGIAPGADEDPQPEPPGEAGR